MSAPLLTVGDLHAYYGLSHVLQGVSLDVPEGGIVTMLGRNGAGKSTSLKAIMGIVQPRRGTVVLAGRALAGEPPYRIARAGIGYVPENRGIFPSLSVLENLTLAARTSEDAPGREGWTLARIFELFPRLYERRLIGGGRLSGGEQQMLSIARALLTNPRLLLLDEPSEGLAPLVIDEIEAVLARLKQTGLAILLVEQNLSLALGLADAVLLLGKGKVQWRGSVSEFAAADEMNRLWLGL
jgi:branched-chain amino acid transport system ATP-binding protein